MSTSVDYVIEIICIMTFSGAYWLLEMIVLRSSVQVEYIIWAC